MIVLDLIVIITTILFFVRWKMSKLDFKDYLFYAGYFKYMVKCYYLIFLITYIINVIVLRIDWNFDFLNYRIF
jgi:hypothetical protein